MIRVMFPPPDEQGQIDYLAGLMRVSIRRDGWIESRTYLLTPPPAKAAGEADTIPQAMRETPVVLREHLPALQTAISAVQSINAEWRARQVTAIKETLNNKEVINLAILACHVETCATRMIIPRDDARLSLSDADMIEFYNHYTS